MRPDYQQRVVDEKDDLTGKIVRLESFLDNPPSGVQVSNAGKRLLTEQVVHMRAYEGVLVRRIEEFDKEQ